MSPVQVDLSEMAAKVLAAEAAPQADRISLLLPRAIRFYLDERDGGREGWEYPSFLPSADGAIAGHSVELDADLWQELRAEAERQEVEPERLLQHAAFYYGAARDEGRLTERIVEELRREMEPSGEREGA